MVPLAEIIAVTLGIAIAVLLVIYVLVPAFAIASKLIAHIFRFIATMIRDTLRAISAIITLLVLAPLIVGTIVIGRWSTAAHFGRAVQYECIIFGRCLYRIAIGNPAHLLGLGVLTEGIEQRIPEAVGRAPRADKPNRRTGQFDGYSIVGSLPGGGSGARIFVAEPDEKKRAIFTRAGHDPVDQVVIKSFSIRDGSSLPQIVRESRSLEAARKLGLVLDHELNEHRFYYVMPYVPGDNLSTATRALHTAAGPDGLGRAQLAEAMRYVADLLTTLDRYHRGGLWHKDVKPDNIIVHDGRAHLVDLGLVTPMRSAMTLTTHGTEYFRDPEMVRMALRGVKVHEVDGAKFDIFATGAVLYSIIEDSFPAHGGLSQITKKCPDALRMIVRRAMTDYNSRYPSVPAMLADLRVVMNASDPYTVRPADLPSMRGQSPEDAAQAEADLHDTPAPLPPAAPAFTPPNPAAAHAPDPTPAAEAPRARPRLRVTGWWTGRYVAEGAQPAHAAAYAAPPAGYARRSPRPPRRPDDFPRGTAQEQRARAKARVQAARARVAHRMQHRRRSARYNNNPNLGVGIGVALTLGALVGSGLIINANRDKVHTIISRVQRHAAPHVQVTVDGDTAGLAAATAIAFPAHDLGQLIILDDLRDAPPGVRRSFVEPIESALSGAGMDLIRADQGEERETMIAHARKDFGAIPPDIDNAFRTKVRRWLSTQPEDLKGVLLLRWSAAGAKPLPTWALFPRGGFDGDWLRHVIGSE